MVENERKTRGNFFPKAQTIKCDKLSKGYGKKINEVS